MPQGTRPQVMRPLGGHAQWGSGHDRGDYGSRSVVLVFTRLAYQIFLVVIAFPLADHVFPFVVIALLISLG